MTAACLNSSVGFISLTLLFTFTPVNSQTLTETTERRAKVAGASHVNLRSGPGVSHPPVTILNNGEEVNVEKLEGSWYLVSLPDGLKGYVYAELIDFLPASEEPVALETEPPPPTPTIEVFLEEATSPAEPEPSEPAPVMETPEEPITPTPVAVDVEVPAQKPPLTGQKTAASTTKAMTVVPRKVETAVRGKQNPWVFWTILSWILAPSCIFILGWILGGNYYLRRDRIERTKLRF